MENRALIALALSFLVFLAFIYFGQQMQPPAVKEAPAPQAEVKPAAPAPAPAAAPEARPAAPARVSERPGRDIAVDTPLFKAVFAEQGGVLKSFQLKKYRESMPFSTLSQFKLGPVDFEVLRYQDPEQAGAPLKELVRVKKGEALPLTLTWEGQNLKVPGPIFYQASQPALTLKAGETASLKLTGASPEGVVFTKTLNFKSDSYAFDLAVKVENRSQQNLEGQVDLDLPANYTGMDASQVGFLGFQGSVNNRLEQLKTGGLKDLKPIPGQKTFTGKVDWAGLDEGYFLAAMVPQAAPKAVLTVKEGQTGPMDVVLRTPATLAPGQDASLAYTFYFGPKELSELKSLNLGLDKAVDFGWFQILAVPLLYILEFFNRYVHNYGWAIIILTIIIRVLFFYPNHKRAPG